LVEEKVWSSYPFPATSLTPMLLERFLAVSKDIRRRRQKI